MKANQKAAAVKGLKTVWICARTFILNTWRRGLILGRYTLICLQRQKLRRAWRLLGAQVMESLAADEVNPMLTDGVKDALQKAKSISEARDRHYQAVAALKEKIAAACACESPAEPPEESPETDKAKRDN
jgi:hypothetical protein